MPIAEFEDPARADEAWARLEAAGIPAGVVTDPSVFGSDPVTRVFVARRHADEAQRLIADIVLG